MEKPIKKYKITIDMENENSEVSMISLVQTPAMEENFLAFSKEEEVQLNFAKMEDKMILTGPAIIPNKNIYRLSAEGEPFYVYFEEETIETIVQKYFSNNRAHNFNLQHNLPVDSCHIIESWIVTDPANDKSTALGFSVPKGTWMISVKVNSEQVWKDEILSGKTKGFSIELEKPVLQSVDFSSDEEDYSDIFEMIKEQIEKLK